MNPLQYVYQLKDHLGNIRISYSDKDNDGKIDLVRNNVDVDGDGDNAHEIREVKDYYPFGLQINYGSNSPNSMISGRKHNYGYNGKEEQNELGLEWLDFSARNYNPAIGRWFVIDPLADAKGQVHNSPYTYAMNNPIYFIDPDGNCPPGVDCADIIAGLATAVNTFLEKNDLVFDINLSADFNLGVGVSANLGDAKLESKVNLLNVELFDIQGSFVDGADSFEADFAGKDGELEIEQSVEASVSNGDTKFSLVEGENSFTAYDDYQRTTNKVQKLDFFSKATQTLTNLDDSSNMSTSLGDGVTVKNVGTSSSKLSVSSSAKDDSSTVKFGGKMGAFFSISANTEIGFKKKNPTNN